MNSSYLVVEGWEMSGCWLLSRCLGVWFFAFVVLLAGCDDGRPVLVEASGRVLLKGQVLTAGSVTFHPDAGNEFRGDSPSSQLQLDGSFRMKTFPWGEGVAVGRYRVTLSPELASRIGFPDYATPEKTPLVLDVPATGVSGVVLEVGG